MLVKENKNTHPYLLTQIAACGIIAKHNDCETRIRMNTMRRKIRVILISVPLICIIAAAVFLMSHYQNTSAKRLKNEYKGSVPRVYSSSDKDEDGIDDQTDILLGALDYVVTKPKYESRYYAGGYSDDEYGVCTDVVANAMMSAGYDLRELVRLDISENPDNYDIEVPDANIDFRRVKNLRVFFSHTAISLTTDVSEICEWQGGDIVIFKGHIGVVSERRNKKGVPYVIHHSGVLQMRYEEDILGSRDDILGHYRVSE